MNTAVLPTAKHPPAAADIPALTESARAVLRALALHGPVTRPKLGITLELSKPTMSAAVAELGALGLVAPRGLEKGSMGRTAMIYGVGPATGYVIGIDVGAAQVRGVAYSLDGLALATAEQQIKLQQDASSGEIGNVIWSTTQQIISAVGDQQGILRCIAVAVPRIVSPNRLGIDAQSGPEAPLARLRTQLAAPILLENNVNCAAIGEMSYGAAAGRETFAYLQVGVRIGLGIILQGRLFRGFGGAAGEIGRLPFPWSSTQMPEREGLEHYLGAIALMARCTAAWPAAASAPRSLPESCSPWRKRGRAMQEAGWTGMPATSAAWSPAVSVCSIPAWSSWAAVLARTHWCWRRSRGWRRTDLAWPTQIGVSPLGNSGTVLGAMKLAADYGLGLLLKEDRHPAVVLPPLDREQSTAA